MCARSTGHMLLRRPDKGLRALFHYSVVKYKQTERACFSQVSNPPNVNAYPAQENDMLQEILCRSEHANVIRVGMLNGYSGGILCHIPQILTEVSIW